MKDNDITKCKVLFAGICGSDINKVKSNLIDVRNIKNLGHEIVCRTENGEICVVNPFVCLEECEACDFSSYMYCDKVLRLGAGELKSGYFGEIEVPSKNLFKIRKAFFPEVGVLVDGVAVVLHGLHMIDFTNINKIAVIGSGSIGVISAIAVKEIIKTGWIDLVVNNDKKADYLEYHFKDYIKIVNKSSVENEKYDLVIEAVGGKQTESISQAINIVKVNGIVLVMGAFDSSSTELLGLRQLFYKQIHIIGVNSFCNKFNDFERAMSWTFEHEEILCPIITDRYLISHSKISSQEIYKDVVKPKMIKGCFVYE